MKVGLFLAEDTREFKSASEMDDSTLRGIRKEYFKKTFVYPLIGFLIAIAVAAVCVTGVITALFGSSDLLDTVFLILVPLCGVIVILSEARCILSLITVIKIIRKKFLWYKGVIRGKEWRYPTTFSKSNKYYSVDDKYFALILANPYYKKGTEVYYLYFPKSPYAGAVVRYEP